MTYIRTPIDVLVQIDEAPQWVRLNAVEAVSVSKVTNMSVIHLSNGSRIHTETMVEDILKKFDQALKPPGPVTVPS